ncbi:MAG: indole-3-glycerol-phosphate synthase [Myxococcales bacterium]
MAEPIDHLARIVERKRVEVNRRARRAALFARLSAAQVPAPNRHAEGLRRPAGEPPRVIAEIKLRSPSAGQIRARAPGEHLRIARSYQRGGASAISVLCDGPGFGGSVLDARRVARQSELPVLFKEFVLSPLQVDAARAAGASLVLLLVRVLSDQELVSLIREVRVRGLEPVVEAADAEELKRALATEATIIGINARDLRTFSVDSGSASDLVARIPADRVAVFMSGVRSAADFARVATTRADAVLIGEGLMRASDPGQALQDMLRAV